MIQNITGKINIFIVMYVDSTTDVTCCLLLRLFLVVS